MGLTDLILGRAVTNAFRSCFKNRFLSLEEKWSGHLIVKKIIPIACISLNAYDFLLWPNESM